MKSYMTWTNEKNNESKLKTIYYTTSKAYLGLLTTCNYSQDVQQVLVREKSCVKEVIKWMNVEWMITK